MYQLACLPASSPSVWLCGFWQPLYWHCNLFQGLWCRVRFGHIILEYPRLFLTTPCHCQPSLSLPHRTPGLRTCDFSEIAGTSLATPVAAGAATIARQYFRDGYYPSGRRSQHSYHPSGALMRAVLIGGAFPMDGFTDLGTPLEPPPGSRQGHGRV